MTYLSTENLSKNYGIKTLFEGLSFGISKGDKTALIAENGTGKSTLLQILAGNEEPDHGEVMIQNGINSGFLEQEPVLDGELTIREYIAQGDHDVAEIIRRYRGARHTDAEN